MNMKNKSTFYLKMIPFLTGMLFTIQAIYAQTSHTVSVSNNVFTPADLTINQGDTVIWTNIEGFHNVNGTTNTYQDNPESFGNQTGFGWTYSYVFNSPGDYDYQCDPHVGLGMVGTISVEEVVSSNSLTINFSGMNPHVGQELSLVVKEKSGGDEIGRLYTTVSESFALNMEGILTGESYEVEFYADHNGNGSYDAPPVDHAWTIDLDNVSGNEVIDFSHNVNFTDIEWEHKVFVNFSGMNPHVGQELYIALFDAESGMEIDRESVMVTESFIADLGYITPGNSYRIDFFSDHNDNDVYDAPPTDHAWSLEINNVSGDEMVDFTHNTNFSDINWVHKLFIDFESMNPHAGQQLFISLMDSETGEEVNRKSLTVTEDFRVDMGEIVSGNSYTIDFFADHNGNGYYDAPPVDHAWRINVNDVLGDEKVEFVHNTNFTEVDWMHKVMVNFSGMNPHVGQQLYISLSDASTGEEVYRTMTTVSPDFTVTLGEIVNGESYHINFFADHNENGAYDAPPTDHAWRLELNEVTGDESLDFNHNTNFTDVEWMHMLKINFFGMAPHSGQTMTLYLRNQESGEYLDTIMIASISESNFELSGFAIDPGSSYNIDFYADHNGNGQYDAPPADHAWRIKVDNVSGDTEVDFTHNTNFTNIFETTSSRALTAEKIILYPVPASEVLNIKTDNMSVDRITVFDISGKEVLIKEVKSQQEILQLNISTLKSGIYMVKVNGGGLSDVKQIIKK